MSKWRRALSLLLVMLMMLSLLPVSAFAADEKETCSIVIQYVYKTSQQEAAPAWTATVSRGSSLKQDVTSPAVVGYTPDRTVVSLDYTNIQEDITLKVEYSPALVDFTVKHYLQNVGDDYYADPITETKQGYTEAAVGKELAKSYPGFTALLYDTTTKIAADGSTVVEIYYDRNYYLLSLDLDGGFGAEPVYARYGAAISVANPEKPGYTFGGWSPALPTTMPAENLTAKAQWTQNDTVNYTVVFWYENADDAEYSYAGSVTQSAAAGTSVSSGDFQNTSFTGRDADHFTYNGDKAETVTVAGDGSTVVNVYYTRNTYTLTFKGGKVELTCGMEEHEHTHDGWYLKAFDGIYYYGGCYPAGSYNGIGTGTGGAKSPTCGKTEHTHSSSCYKTSDLTITAKYQADIHGNFPIKDGDKTIWWTVPSNCESFKSGNYLGSIDTMPGENITFTKYESQSGAKIYYYIETLNGASGQTSYNEKNYNLYKVIDLKSSGISLTYKEEFHPILGFTQGDSNPYLPVDGSVEVQENNYLYYTRNSYTLSFYNYNAEVTGKKASVQYEAPLKDYDFTPDYPAGLETNAYEFAGWYTTPGCFDGSEANWDAMTMPANDLMLYAKWTPKTHTVRTFQTEDGTLLNTWENVAHRSTIEKPDDPTNGNYTFVGWFYRENGVEKAFDFSMAITKDLDLYAKWSSNTLVLYTVKYQLEDGTTIAEETTGSALAGTTRTFNAKGGNDLYEAYREGYFPTTSSHSLTLDIEGNNEYTFVYVQREAVAYTVKYVDAATGEELIDAKYVADNRNAVVTEKYAVIPGYMPDAVYKRLVVTADGTNEIIFYYTKDEQHAPVTINYWTQTPDGSTYAEHSTQTFTGNIGTEYGEKSKDIEGFTYVANPTNPLTGHDPLASGVLTANGLELNLYYDRNSYQYTIRYVDYETGEDIDATQNVTGNALFGATVTGNQKQFPGYMPADNEPAQKQITIGTGTNEIIFYYYKCFYVGHVQTTLQTTDTVRLTGGNYSLTNAVTDGYLYGGAFSNAACDAEHVQSFTNGENALGFHPEKGQTYYIWEVDQKYLVPKTTSVWGMVEGKQTVTKVYLMTVVDRLLYSKVGFIKDSADRMSEKDGTNVAYGTVRATKKGELFRELYVENGLLQVTKSGAAPESRDAGYIGVYKLTSKEFAAFKSTPFEFQPFWVTLDGVRVTGVQERTCTYRAPAATDIGVVNKDVASSKTLDTEASTQSLTFVAAYSYDADPDSAEPVEPPVENKIVVTVNDNGSVSEIPAQPGADLTGKIEYAGADGKLFAGWFTDESYTCPADLSNVQESMTIYARYVSDAYLRFKFVQQRLFGSNVYLFSAIDSGDYAETGFVINGVLTPADYVGSRYSTYSARLLFSGLDKNAKLMVGSCPLRGMRRGDTLTVAPYWVTPDGTTVYGTERTLTYGRFGLEG